MRQELKKSKVLHICERVLDAYEQRFGLFSKEGIEKKIFPEKQLAKLIKNKDDLALWFFFTCPGDKRINSIRYYEQLGKFYLKNPDFFNLNKINNSGSESNINSILDSVNITNHSEFLRTIHENSKKLTEKFDGNPLNAIRDNDYDSCVKNLTDFLGYGKEIASLYLVFLSRYGVKKTKNIAPKVDRHLLRISAGCGVFNVKKNLRVDKATKEVSRLYTEVCKKKSIDGTLLDALTYAIGNDLCSKKNEVLCMENCPLDYYCSKQLPKINKKDTTLYIEKKEKTQQFLNFSPKRGLWSPDIPVSYWPKNIREKFMEHAGILYKDLKEHKLEVKLVKISDGRKKRALQNENPSWYKKLIRWGVIKGSNRYKIVNALEAISKGEDNRFCRYMYKNQSILRNLIFERLTEGYIFGESNAQSTLFSNENGIPVPPDREVAEYFGVKTDINKKPEMSENYIDTPF